MDAPRGSTQRRDVGQHIGAVLRHARNAAALNLQHAPLGAIQREMGHVIDCAGLVVWDRKDAAPDA